MKERFRSALLGTALGDAWSYPYHMPPQPPTTPLPYNLLISDDTQMTLALSTAMRSIDRHNLSRSAGMREIARGFISYYSDADYDRFPGASNTQALRRLKDLGVDHWDTVSTHSGGSGAVMRIAASALLAPRDTGIGWSVMQATLTHDSAVARAASAVTASAFIADDHADLIDVALGLAGSASFDADTILSDADKSDIVADCAQSVIHDLTGPDVSFTELLERTAELRSHFADLLVKDDFDALYRQARQVQQIIGKGWDAGSCAASAILLTQLYLDFRDDLYPHDLLHVAVNWPGNRNTRASLTGGLIGAHLDRGIDFWEESRTYEFEPRYNDAIHSGLWKGF